MKEAVINFVSGSMGIFSIFLAVLITRWWRNRHIYITDNIFTSWMKTFGSVWVLTFLVVSVLTAPILWLIGVACDYWYVTVALIAFMCYGGNDSSPEGENTDAADDGAGKSGENDDASGGNSDGGKA